jgi:transcription antitermination factor NusG
MPILKKENDIYPESLFSDPALYDARDRNWWCLYTRSRQEKELNRRLLTHQIAYYCPTIPKRYRSPNGRIRTSYIPLFPNYVFMLGNEDERIDALTSNCISRCTLVTEREQFVEDLCQIRQLVLKGVPLTPEGKLEPGQRVRVKNGPFIGYEGVVIRREGKTRFLLALRFLEKGVSMELDEGSLEPL